MSLYEVDPFCDCATNSIETTDRCLLHCSDYLSPRSILFDDLKNAALSFIPFNSKKLARSLLFGDSSLRDKDNYFIISFVVNYILTAKRFERPLLE